MVTTTQILNPPPVAHVLDELAHATGSTEFYRHFITRTFYHTSGVEHMAKIAKAYWIIDSIAFAQRIRRVNVEEFQVWILRKNKSGTGALLICEDGNERAVYRTRIEYTDFPFPASREFKMYAEGPRSERVLMLPQER